MRKSILILTGLSLFLNLSLYSLPRFAARMNLPCQSCHVNPSGGGMRNAFGESFGRDSLSVKAWDKDFALNDFSPRVTDFISYGADFRFLAFYQSHTSPDVSPSSFFPMQMDLYFNLAVSKKISLYVNPAFGPYNRLEVFGLAKVLPAGGYLKLGRFTPPYGLRLDDHTSFVRQATPFRDNMGQQSGIEVGLNPGPVSIMELLRMAYTAIWTPERRRLYLATWKHTARSDRSDCWAVSHRTMMFRIMGRSICSEHTVWPPYSRT